MLYNKLNKKIKYFTSIFTFIVVILSSFSIFASNNLPEAAKLPNKQAHKQRAKQGVFKIGSTKSKSVQQQATEQKNSKDGSNDNPKNNDSNTEELVQITDAYARASIPGSKNSALFMKVKNLTEQNLTIIDVQAKEVANKTELHTTIKDKDTGFLKMQKVDNVVVEAKNTAEFKSGGDHVMLLDLKRELKDDDNFEASVSFKEIEPIAFVVKVKK